MNQPNFKIPLSLGTKLLLSVVLLLISVILFINISSIYLFRDDKKDTIFENQSTTALLLGNHFVSKIHTGLDTLKTLLASSSFDPKRKDQNTATLRSIIDNQSELVLAGFYQVNPKNSATDLKFQIARTQPSSSGEAGKLETLLSKEILEETMPELQEHQFAFVNLSKINETPQLALLLLDTSDTSQKKAGGSVLGVGLLSLKEFSEELGRQKLTLANQEGALLFDTDPAALISKDSLAENPLFKKATAQKLLNGALEFELNGERTLGSFVNPGLGLVVLAQTRWTNAMKATYLLIEKFLLLGSMAIGLTVILSILFARSLTGPLAELHGATQAVAQGNFDLELHPTTSDEIAALAHSFNLMSKKIVGLIEEKVDQVKTEKEIEIVSTVQQNLIPPSLIERPFIHIASHYQAASKCGGDWWGFLESGDYFCMMIADATGHGLSSAFMTASASSCFSVIHKLATDQKHFPLTPNHLLSIANRVIHDASHGRILMTFFIGILNTKTSILSFASAGHNPPWLFRKEGDQYSSQSLIAMGPRLGESETSPQFEEVSIPLMKGDKLFMYTDGLLDATDDQGRAYGKKRAKKQLTEAINRGGNAPLGDLLADFKAHLGGKEILDDDLTMALATLL